MDDLTAGVAVAGDNADELLAEVAGGFLELGDDTGGGAGVALLAGDQQADLLAGDGVEDVALLWGAVGDVAEEAVEDGLEPAGHAVPVQRHGVDDSVGGQDVVQEKVLVAVVERAAAVGESTAAAVAEQALDVVVEEYVFNLVAGRPGPFDRCLRQQMGVAVVAGAGADDENLHETSVGLGRLSRSYLVVQKRDV